VNIVKGFADNIPSTQAFCHTPLVRLDIFTRHQLNNENVLTWDFKKCQGKFLHITFSYICLVIFYIIQVIQEKFFTSRIVH